MFNIILLLHLTMLLNLVTETVSILLFHYLSGLNIVNALRKENKMIEKFFENIHRHWKSMPAVRKIQMSSYNIKMAKFAYAIYVCKPYSDTMCSFLIHLILKLLNPLYPAKSYRLQPQLILIASCVDEKKYFCHALSCVQILSIRLFFIRNTFYQIYNFIIDLQSLYLLIQDVIENLSSN